MLSLADGTINLIVSYKNLDKLQQIVAPYVTRREQKDCLDLSPTIETHVEVPLTESTWRVYKQMRDECVVWLNEHPTLAAQAGVKVMRLAQITSGYLGGFKDDESRLDAEIQTLEVGREKLDWLLGWTSDRLEEDPTRKIIVWCRFRKELERVAEELKPLLPTYKLYGGQSKVEREEAKERFSRLGNDNPAMLCAQPQAGGFGLNLIAADTNVYLSHDHSLMRRLQSKERSHGPGQKKSVLYVDVIATGPKGQKTVDHAIVKALRSHQELANWTVQAWKHALED